MAVVDIRRRSSQLNGGQQRIYYPPQRRLQHPPAGRVPVARSRMRRRSVGLLSSPRLPPHPRHIVQLLLQHQTIL
eukprot:13929-Eustigmatos_ZCMA.PRE.1